MGEQSSKMSPSVLTVFLVLTISSPSSLAINFPSSKPAQGRLVFNRQTFSTASCAASGETVTTVSLNTGEGRVFQSPNYPANYPDGQSCTYNLEPAAGNQLVLSCSDYDLKATSSVGDLCTGDYLRFYDANGALGQSGTRYCHTTGPAFSYTTDINVLFKTNNDGTTGKGFDCQVVAELIPTTTTTTTTTTPTTTTTTPSATDCITIGGPGATKPCLETFSYDHVRTVYRGCINKETPGQYISVVPDFGDNGPAPKDESSEKLTAPSSNSISFLGSVSALAPRLSSRHHGSGEVNTLFWCATQADSDGYISEWGQCAAGCKADPAGSYLPAAPRTAALLASSPTVGDLIQLIQASTSSVRPPSK